MLTKLALLLICCCAALAAAGRHDRRSVDEYTAHGHRHPSLPVNVDWLTEEQHAALDDEDTDVIALMAKVRHFYDRLPDASETKKAAARKIVEQCYRWLPTVTSQEERAALKQLHHSDHNACKGKVNEYMGRLPEAEQTQLRRHWHFCEHVYYDSHVGHEHNDAHAHHSVAHHLHEEQQPAASRRRRDHHEGHEAHHGSHTLDDYFKTHLSWLTTEQQDALRTMKTEGKSRSELQQKILEYYEATTGETRTKAAELLKGGCRELLTSIVGAEKAQEIKTLKETGASLAELQGKVDELLAAVSDPHKKGVIQEYGPACRKIFGVAGGASEVPAAGRRRRREEPSQEGSKLEQYFATHLSWLSDEQKATLRTLKAEGKSRTDLQQKVLEFFDATTGEARIKASELLKGGCREVFTPIIGAEKVQELKAMKESGTPTEEIQAKVDVLLAAVTDEKHKEMVQRFGPVCKRIFREAAASRRRRDHHEGHEAHHGNHTLDDYFKTHLSWLTEEQRTALKTLKAEGGSRSAIQQKVLEYYEATAGETREKAAELLKGGCRELLTSIVGAEKAQEVKTLKESGASLAELQQKVDQLLAAVTDEHKKAVIQEYGPACRKIFGAAASGRRRRAERRWDEDANTQLEDQYRGQNDVQGRDEHGGQRRDQEQQQTPAPRDGRRRDFDQADHHSGWLTDEQRDQLREHKERGDDQPTIQNKVLEFFHVSPDDVKEMARSLLTSGCEKLLGNAFGEEKADELKRVRAEEGAARMEQRVQEYAGELEDDGQRAEALRYGSTCKKIFEMLVRRRRHDAGQGMDEEEN